MMELQKIAKEISISDSASVKGALKRLKSVPDHELQYYIVLRDTLNSTSAETRDAITLALIESNRRDDGRKIKLSVWNTILSGLIGLAGVILGAYLKS
jgi:hypothetical protein